MTQKHKSASEQVKELQEKVDLLSDTLNQSLDAMRSIIIRVAQSANTIADLESRLQKVELRESALQQLLSKNGTIDLEAKKQPEMKLEKSPFEMNEQELLEATKLLKRKKVAKPVGIAPIPSMSPQQVEGLYMAKAVQSQHSSDPKVLAGNRILGAIGGAPLVAEADQD